MYTSLKFRAPNTFGLIIFLVLQCWWIPFRQHIDNSVCLPGHFWCKVNLGYTNFNSRYKQFSDKVGPWPQNFSDVSTL